MDQTLLIVIIAVASLIVLVLILSLAIGIPRARKKQREIERLQMLANDEEEQVNALAQSSDDLTAVANNMGEMTQQQVMNPHPVDAGFHSPQMPNASGIAPQVNAGLPMGMNYPNYPHDANMPSVPSAYPSTATLQPNLVPTVPYGMPTAQPIVPYQPNPYQPRVIPQFPNWQGQPAQPMLPQPHRPMLPYPGVYPGRQRPFYPSVPQYPTQPVSGTVPTQPFYGGYYPPYRR